jgi:hypothetical protein
MQPGTHRKAGTATLCTVALLLTTAAPSYCGAVTDSFQSIAEQAWIQQYIPRSDEEALPLTDYDDFEVTELFRAETIEDLEASLTDGYPMPWLERVLKDESIPWEDRYWLDCRVRAAIAQNTHTFFNPMGSPVHIDADAVFPGELYWREHMIVDPAGWNVPEGMPRPANLDSWDIGYLMNLFGRKKGDIAVPAFNISTSRNADVSVYVSGGYSIENTRNHSYACFMYPDGTFKEMPPEKLGFYGVAVSQDGSTVVLSCKIPNEHNENTETPVYVFDQHGNLQRTIIPQTPLNWCWRPTISSDGQYLCHTAYGANTCLIDCWNGTYEILSKPLGFFDRYTGIYGFSPDDKILCLSGSTTGRTLSLFDRSEHLYEETEPLNSIEHAHTIVCSSNNRICTTLTTRRKSNHTSSSDSLVLYIGDRLTYRCQLHELEACLDLKTDISPDGHFLFANPSDDFCGYPSAFGYSELYNLPLIVMQIEGR